MASHSNDAHDAEQQQLPADEWDAGARAAAVLGQPPRQSPPPKLSVAMPWATLPSLSADEGTSGAYDVRAASLRGRQHASKGVSRQDDFCVAVTPSGALVVAVADGVGSAAESAVGAHLAAHDACQLIVRHAARHAGEITDLARVFELVRRAMVRRASRQLGRDVQPADVATTLTVCVFAEDGAVSARSVGDTQAFLLGDGEWQPLLPHRQGEFSNVVQALPMSGNDAATTFTGTLQAGDVVMIATDGVAFPLASEDVNGFFAEAWRTPPSLPVFLRDLRFDRRGESDDRTAVCCWYTGG